MRKLFILGAIALIALLGWFIAWYSIMAPDVARVQASFDHHYQRLRETNHNISLKADKIYATGFPFKFQVAVEKALLSVVDMNETFAVEVPKMTLTPIDAAQGRYRVDLPSTIEAFYAKDGATPERYFVTADAMPKLNVGASDSKMKCGPLTGKACEAVDVKAPLISYAVGVPKSITLKMELNGESRTETFGLAPMEINVPIYQEIPRNPSGSLQLFVGVLREALVFKTPSSPDQ